MDLKDPSLKDIIAEADRFENAKSNLKTLAGQTGQTSAAGAAAVQKEGKPKERCGKCGRSVHKAGKPCPAKDKSCHLCKMSGHFSPMCPDKKKGQGRSVSFERSKERPSSRDRTDSRDRNSRDRNSRDRNREKPDWPRRKHTPANSRSVSPAETVAAVYQVGHGAVAKPRPDSAPRHGVIAAVRQPYTLQRGGLTPRLAVEVSQGGALAFPLLGAPGLRMLLLPGRQGPGQRSGGSTGVKPSSSTSCKWPLDVCGWCSPCHSYLC